MPEFSVLPNIFAFNSASGLQHVRPDCGLQVAYTDGLGLGEIVLMRRGGGGALQRLRCSMV